MLLATKLFIPQPHPTTVRRPRLLQLIAGAQQAKLMLVCAPAGAGKTTLIADWIGEQVTTSARRAAWLSLDDGDNDPVRFLTYVVAALQTANPTLGQSVQTLLQSPQPPTLNALLPLLLQDLTQTTEQFVLVLDDYHLINTQQIHEALTFLITHLPPTLVIVILSRNDPPLPLSRWRVRRELLEVRQRELRFTEAELTEFMRQEVGGDLAPSTITALLERTEGWIAGLQLAAISMNDRANLADFVQGFTGSHAYIVDYLSEEVLNRQSPAVRRFLLQTSILTRMCAALCDAVLDDREEGAVAATGGESQQVLIQLERANLFLIPLDHERRWYRYHHLFAEVLQKWLRQSATATIPQLHRRACRWYETEGLLGDAIHHALAAGDFAHAGRLIEATADSLRKQGEFMTLADLLNRLPTAVLQTHPRLALERASTLVFQHQLDEAERWLAAAEDANRSGNHDASIRGHVAAIRTDIAVNRGDLPGAIKLAQAALADLPPTDWYTRSFVMLLLGVAYFWSYQYTAATQSYEAALQLARQSRVLLITIYTLAAKAEVLQRQGLLQAAQATLQSAFDYAREHKIEQATMLASSLIQMGELHYEWHELAKAADYVAQGLARAQQAYNPRTELHVYTCALRVAAASQNPAEVQKIIQQATHLIQQFQLPAQMVNDFQIGQWRQALQEHNHQLVADGLQAWAHQHNEPMVTDIENIDLLRARLLIAQAKDADALVLLQTVIQAAEAINNLPHVLEALALTAIALAGTGQQALARQVTQQLLLRAQPAGFIRSIVDAGPVLRDLIAHCTLHISSAQPQWLADNGVLAEQMRVYLDKLLAAFADQPLAAGHVTSIGTKPHHTPQPTASSLVEQLSVREIEVLRLVNEGLSNTQIAARLIISVGTVKRHLNNIFGKLGVGSRTEALAQARDLALL